MKAFHELPDIPKVEPVETEVGWRNAAALELREKHRILIEGRSKVLPLPDDFTEAK